MNFVEWCFTDAEHQRTFLLKADVCRALNQLGGNTVGNAGESAHAARNDDHRVSGVGTAGDIGTDIRIGLLVNFTRWLARCVAENLSDEVAAAAEAEFLGHYA